MDRLATITGVATVATAVLFGCGGTSQLPRGSDDDGAFTSDRDVVATQPVQMPSGFSMQPVQTPSVPANFGMQAPPAGGSAPGFQGQDDPFIVTGPSPAECVFLASPRVDQACRECTCYRAPECAQAISDCGDACWALLRCMGEFCSGLSGDEACIIEHCSAHLAGAELAGPAVDCYQGCLGECQSDPALDAGVSDAGADPMDAAATDAAAADGGVPDGALDDEDAGI